MAEEQEGMKRLLGVEELADSIEQRVDMFAQQYVSLPGMIPPCEVMDIGQLRDAMGLHVMPEGDAWQMAERLLVQRGMYLQMMGGRRVMFLRERDDFIQPTGWVDVEEEE